MLSSRCASGCRGEAASPKPEAVGICHTHAGIEAFACMLLGLRPQLEGPGKRQGSTVSVHEPQRAFMCMLA